MLAGYHALTADSMTGGGSGYHEIAIEAQTGRTYGEWKAPPIVSVSAMRALIRDSKKRHSREDQDQAAVLRSGARC